MRRNQAYRFGFLLALCVEWTLIAGIQQAQPPWGEPIITFNKTFGGTGSDAANSVKPTTDGGYIIAGSSTPDEGAPWVRLWLIKTDRFGSEIWNKLYGENFFFAVASDVQQTTDQGYITIGWSAIVKYEAYLLKTSQDGTEEWSTHGYLPPLGGMGTSVQQTSDGGFITSGTWFGTPGVGWIEKTDLLGNVQWTQYFSSISYFTEANSVQQTPDGGYIVCGAGYPALDQPMDLWLIKTTATGVVQWNRHYGGQSYEIGRCVTQAADGGYIVAGVTNSYGAGGTDGWLIRTDATGNILWDKTFGGTRNDSLYWVSNTGDGGYILAGATDSLGAGGSDGWLIKTDVDGNTLWEKTFGGPGNDSLKSVSQSHFGGYIAAGSTDSYGAGSTDVWLIKTDEQGNAPAEPSQ